MPPLTSRSWPPSCAPWVWPAWASAPIKADLPAPGAPNRTMRRLSGIEASQLLGRRQQFGYLIALEQIAQPYDRGMAGRDAFVRDQHMDQQLIGLVLDMPLHLAKGSRRRLALDQIIAALARVTFAAEQFDDELFANGALLRAPRDPHLVAALALAGSVARPGAPTRAPSPSGTAAERQEEEHQGADHPRAGEPGQGEHPSGDGALKCQAIEQPQRRAHDEVADDGAADGRGDANQQVHARRHGPSLSEWPTLANQA